MISTLISGVSEYLILRVITYFENNIEFSDRLITALVGLLLLFTAWLQFKQKNNNKENSYCQAGEVNIADSILLGLAQAAAVLPGLSRSGLTICSLLLRKVNDEDALRLSFLMSLPIVLAGNILLNLDMLTGNLSIVSF